MVLPEPELPRSTISRVGADEVHPMLDGTSLNWSDTASKVAPLNLLSGQFKQE
ncbi:hypothetical protein [Nonomuraea sp. B5E05]|uniref:hypothetical protein n=1 Tax=Nonomuraea sp. B5E05 TaxID=3153569 RepID=UPI0032600167